MDNINDHHILLLFVIATKKCDTLWEESPSSSLELVSTYCDKRISPMELRMDCGTTPKYSSSRSPK